MSVLSNATTLVEFDPTNKDHLHAFQMLTEDNRQHPTLRFKVPFPFLDVRTVMYDRISRAYLDVVMGK